MSHICCEILLTSENKLIRDAYFNVNKCHKNKVGKIKSNYSYMIIHTYKSSKTFTCVHI